jgi:MFS family permease
MTLFLQRHLGWGPLETGLAFAAMIVELLIAPSLTPRIVTRFGNLPTLIAGLTSITLAFALTLRLNASTGFFDLLPTLLLVGVAFALIYGPITAAAVEGVDESQHGVAGGILYTGFQFGAALGVSIATVALISSGHKGPTDDDYQLAMIVPLAAVVLGLALSLVTVTVTVTVIHRRHRARSVLTGPIETQAEGVDDTAERPTDA